MPAGIERIAGIPIAASVQVSGATDPYVSALIFQGATRNTIAWEPLHPLRPEGPGVFGGILPLPYLDPGEYVVELQVVDTTAEAVRLMPLRVVEGQ